MADEINGVIAILREQGKITDVSTDEDFYEAGVSSISALSILMELESVYEVSIPDDDFIACRTAQSLLAMINRLKSASI